MPRMQLLVTRYYYLRVERTAISSSLEVLEKEAFFHLYCLHGDTIVYSILKIFQIFSY